MNERNRTADFPIPGFWAKLRRGGEPPGITGWLSVEDHSADVAACFEALLERTHIGLRLARLAGRERLDETTVARLSSFVALHDMGKFNLGFQNKAVDDPRKMAACRVHAGHLKEVMALLEGGDERLFGALPTETFASWGDEVGYDLLLATIGHHGHPIDAQNCYVANPSIWGSRPGQDPFAGIKALADRLPLWFPEAFRPGGPPLPDSKVFTHGYAGAVMLADWLGSDERFFPFETPAGLERIAFARQQARRALAQVGLDVRAARAALGSEAITFERLTGLSPRPLQAAMGELDLVGLDGSASITVLEAATGAGKTEAALFWFFRLFQAGLVDGLTFALPTRAAATQIHRRIADLVRRAFGGSSVAPPVILAVPGYLRVDDVDARAQLPDFRVLWPDEPGAQWQYRAWAAERPKRFLAGAIVVGTVDQLLLSALRSNHAHLRATAALRHLIVVDEVHASDLYMGTILREVLRFHLRAGGHCLLMSATLGSEARVELLQALETRHRTVAPPPLAEVSGAAYPLITQSRGNRRAERRVSLRSRDGERRVRVELAAWLAEPDRIAWQAVEEARRGLKVLIIRNTVRDCIRTQQAVEVALEAMGIDAGFRCGGRRAPHHGRFAPADRRLLDGEVERQLGKTRPPGGLVLVATQTVEQSLDIDADLLMTDLCPIDVLLQRLGRLHRHERRDRPPAAATPRVVVLTPTCRRLTEVIEVAKSREDEQLKGPAGLGTVYDCPFTLQRTWECLQQNPVLLLPRQNRALVEFATHPEGRKALLAEDPEAWGRYVSAREGSRAIQRVLAGLNLLDRMDKTYAEAPFTDLTREGAAKRVATRLGTDQLRLEFDEPPVGPFGQRLRGLNISAFLLRRDDQEGLRRGEIDTRIFDERGEGFSLEVGRTRLRYDRLGLRHLEEDE